MLQINNLQKNYGNKTILKINELVVPGGIVHLRGINGSGKTTFSKIIAGLIPFQGELLLNDSLSPVNTKVEYRKQVNYSESEPNYPEFLSANDLILFVGKAKGASIKRQKTLVETFGVNEYLYDQIGTYSSGMMKRLSLVLAFLGNPSLVLLDEPFNALDTKAIEILKNIIVQTQEKGVDFILVSHQDIDHLSIPIDACLIVKNHTITTC